MKRISLVVLALASAALAAGPAGAQVRSGTRGPVVGLDLSGSDLGIGSTPGTSRGAGLGLSLGYGVSERVSLFTRAGVAYQIGHVDVGARYSFGGTASRLRPYVEGALTRAGSSALPGLLEAPPSRSYGYGLTGGAGAEYFLTRHVALDLGLTHSRGRFTTGALDGRAFAATRLNLGFKWHP